MIVWTDIEKEAPGEGEKVLVYLPRRERTQEVVWRDYQKEILFPSHWTRINLPSEDLSGEIAKMAAAAMGSRSSEKKREAARRNGHKGGRRKKDAGDQHR